MPLYADHLCPTMPALKRPSRGCHSNAGRCGRSNRDHLLRRQVPGADRATGGRAQEPLRRRVLGAVAPGGAGVAAPPLELVRRCPAALPGAGLALSRRVGRRIDHETLARAVRAAHPSHRPDVVSLIATARIRFRSVWPSSSAPSSTFPGAVRAAWDSVPRRIQPSRPAFQALAAPSPVFRCRSGNRWISLDRVNESNRRSE
jgi:hypothetical protein